MLAPSSWSCSLLCLSECLVLSTTFSRSFLSLWDILSMSSLSLAFLEPIVISFHRAFDSVSELSALGRARREDKTNLADRELQFCPIMHIFPDEAVAPGFAKHDLWELGHLSVHHQHRVDRRTGKRLLSGEVQRPD